MPAASKNSALILPVALPRRFIATRTGGFFVARSSSVLMPYFSEKSLVTSM